MRRRSELKYEIRIKEQEAPFWTIRELNEIILSCFLDDKKNVNQFIEGLGDRASNLVTVDNTEIESPGGIFY
jgi:hypothetical protein